MDTTDGAEDSNMDTTDGAEDSNMDTTDGAEDSNMDPTDGAEDSGHAFDVLASNPGTSRNVATESIPNYFDEVSDFVEREIFKMKMGLSPFGKIADSDSDDGGDDSDSCFNVINYNEDEEELQLPNLECSELPTDITNGDISEDKEQKIKTIKRALEVNKELRDMLTSFENDLTLKLELIKERLAHLKKTNADATTAESQDDLIKKGAYMKLRIPYFKDEKNFPCPPNEDYLDKVKKDALIVMDLPRTKFWNRLDVLKLEMGVKECIITELQNRIDSKRSVLDSKIEKGIENLDAYYEEIETLKKNLDICKNKSVSDLLKDYPPDREYDWLRISAMCFGNDHSEVECQKFWHLYAKPSINKSRWSKCEDERLIEIAKKHNEQNWELIAKELNTSRSQYQCFIHYQTRLNYKNTLSTGPFTQEEDEKILFFVKTLQKGDYIPWINVAHHIRTRSPGQIRTRYMCCLNPNFVKGRFTENEDLFIVSGRLAYGFGFSTLAQLLQNRSVSQVRDRFNRATGILKTKVGSWSLEEDKRLLELVKIYGEKNWSKISKHICTRSRTQIRQHYNVIKKKNYDIYKIARYNTKYRKNIEKKTKTLKTTDQMKSILDNAGGFLLSDVERQHLIGENLNYFLRRSVKRNKKKGNSEHSLVDKELTEFFIECSSGVSVKKRNLEPEFDSLVNQMHAVCDYFLVDLSSEDIRDKIMNSSHMDDLLKRILLKVSEDKRKNEDMSVDEDIVEGNIDYIPNRDLCIVFHETWLLEKNSAFVNNFSELLKAPLMEYSRGLHKDILDKIMVQNKVIIRGSSIEKGWSNCNKDLKIPFVLPPTYMSENNLRTLMLSRRKFEKAISHNRQLFDPACFVNSCDEGDDIFKSKFERKTLTPSFVFDMPASRKFEERLLTLYHWPTIMSLCTPPNFEQFCQYLHTRATDVNMQGEPVASTSQQQENSDHCGKDTESSQSGKVTDSDVSSEFVVKQRKRQYRNPPGFSFLRKSKKSKNRSKKKKLDKKSNVESNNETGINVNAVESESAQQ